jgi:hypothetical protein
MFGIVFYSGMARVARSISLLIRDIVCLAFDNVFLDSSPFSSSDLAVSNLHFNVKVIRP